MNFRSFGLGCFLIGSLFASPVFGDHYTGKSADFEVPTGWVRTGSDVGEAWKVPMTFTFPPNVVQGKSYPVEPEHSLNDVTARFVVLKDGPSFSAHLNTMLSAYAKEGWEVDQNIKTVQQDGNTGQLVLMSRGTDVTQRRDAFGKKYSNGGKRQKKLFYLYGAKKACIFDFELDDVLNAEDINNLVRDLSPAFFTGIKLH